MNEKYFTNLEGKVAYKSDILIPIISLAVREISGVSSVIKRGVKIKVADNAVDIDVFINVKTKICCTEVAFRVQENIKRSVETMTKFKTNVIRIHIIGLAIDDNDGQDNEFSEMNL